ncbi:MAG TPA: chitinase [Candidatus Limnocylindrales bacterium]
MTRIRSIAATFGFLATLLVLVNPAAAFAATPMPRHVFSPYFESWTSDKLAATATQSGARYFTMAFLETLGRNSCTLAWNGDSGRKVADGDYLNDLDNLRSKGGDVTISFGGWSADQHGREIGDSCKDASRVAQAYEQVVTMYDVSRLDMDIEGRSLGRTNGIDRRNKAIKLLQDWASAHNRPLTISYTLPTSRDGLESDGMAVLQNAIDNGVHIDVVQPMVFDYYDGVDQDMGDSAISALKGVHSQLATLLPSKSGAQVWKHLGATLMIGRDDYPTDIETTTVSDAKQVRSFAESKGMAVLSFWAIQRDNGGCPGNPGSDDCSGIAQRHWAFTRALKGFTGP